MEVLIFGASGKTGHQLVRQALEEEYSVTAFVRDPAKMQIRHAGLEVIKGNVKDYSSVSDAVHPRCDAVLSALGAKSPLKRDRSLTRGVENIVRSMEEKGVRRIIYLSFAGVSDSQKQLPFFFRMFAVPILSGAIADHEEKERIIMQSNLEWIIARPVLLSNNPHTGKVIAGENLRPNLKDVMVSRADVADFMLKNVADNTFLRKGAVLA